MTIETSQARISYSITGGGPYTIPFRFLNDVDIKAYTLAPDGVTQLQLISGSDFTVTGAGLQSGFLTLVNPDIGYTLIIINDPELTQLVDYPEAGKFPAASNEGALDKLTIIAIRLKNLIDRSLQFSDADPSSSAVLPVSQPNKYIGFNSLKAIALLDAPNLDDTLAAQAAAEAAAAAIVGFENDGAWVTATPYVVNNLVQENGSTYICLVAHTSGVFATDYSGGKWGVFAAKGSPGAGTGDMLGANNLSDLANAGTARANLGLGNAAVKSIGAAAGNVPLWENIPFNGVSDISSGYTVIAGDRGKIFNCTGTFTIALTAAATLGNGFMFAVRNSGAGVVTIDPNASETVDDSATVAVNPGESCVVVCDGDEFYTVAKPTAQPFSKQYVTPSPQTISTSALLTLAHGMAAVPTLIQPTLVCQTADSGYSPGDILFVAHGPFGSTQGMQIWADTTNIYVRFNNHASLLFASVHKTSGSLVYLTHSKWKLALKAWV